MIILGLRFFSATLENSPAVVALLKDNPFPDHPPLYVRANFTNIVLRILKRRKKQGLGETRVGGMYFPS